MSPIIRIHSVERHAAELIFGDPSIGLPPRLFTFWHNRGLTTLPELVGIQVKKENKPEEKKALYDKMNDHYGYYDPAYDIAKLPDAEGMIIGLVRVVAAIPTNCLDSRYTWKLCFDWGERFNTPIVCPGTQSLSLIKEEEVKSAILSQVKLPR